MFQASILPAKSTGPPVMKRRRHKGLLSGLNAALGRARTTIQCCFQPCSDSYIGVMVDDLITRGVTRNHIVCSRHGPNFVCRLRADNADQRLTPIGDTALGCVSATTAEKRIRCQNRKRCLETGRARCWNRPKLDPNRNCNAQRVFKMNQDGERVVMGYNYLAFPDIEFRTT